MDRDHDHDHDTSDGAVSPHPERAVADGRTDLGAASAHGADDAHLSHAELARVRTMLNDGTLDDQTSRFKWFLLGFLFALLALAVAAVVFLAVSDQDDNGNIDLQVPTIDVDVDG